MEELRYIKNIAKRFKISSDPIRIYSNDTGLINKSYIVQCEKDDYIIQKINNYVFTNPSQLMKNIILITKHLIKNNKKTLNIIQTTENENYLCLNNEYYRCYSFIDNTISYDYSNNLKLLYEFGKKLGEFHYDLINFDENLLSETIKDFHNTPLRLQTLINSYNKSDNEKQIQVKEYYDFILAHEIYLKKIVNGISDNQIPLKVAHYDTKLNNCLFNRFTNKAVCIIDLDTVMKGSRLFDIGDAIRSSCITVKEDSNEFEIVDIDISKFICFLIGYFSIMKNYLTDSEIDLLVDSCIIISFECSIRFLTDYLDGNKYFHIDYEKQNLVRSINQLTLARRLLNRKESLNKIIRNIIIHL